MAERSGKLESQRLGRPVGEASRPAPEGGRYPAEWACDVVLSDGGTVHLRPVRPDDADRIAAMHQRLSHESLFYRYFSHRRHLPEAQLERFTHVDYDERMAFVALLGERLIGFASYDRLEESGEIEVSFAIEDDHHGRGLGTLLLEHLAAVARANGIHRVVANVIPENQAMRRVFREAGYRIHGGFDEGVIHVELEIDPTPRARRAIEARERSAEARSLGRFLKPRSIVLIGEHAGEAEPLAIVAARLQQAGFSGSIQCLALGPRDDLLAALAPATEHPSLAILLVAPARVTDVLDACATRGVESALVLSAGFSNGDVQTGGQSEAAASLRREVVERARRNGMRILGPDSLGLVDTDPAAPLFATREPVAATPGTLALLTESAALGHALLRDANAAGIGISSFMSLGARSDVSSNDCLEFWDGDERTRVVALAIEHFGNPHKFGRLARRVSMSRPVVLLDLARTSGGGPSERALEALFRQAGLIRVDTPSDLFDTARLLDGPPLPGGRRIAIVSDGSGAGELAAAACERAGLALPGPSGACQIGLEADGSVWKARPRAPLRLPDRARADDYARACLALLGDPRIDALLVVGAATSDHRSNAARTALARLAAGPLEKPVCCSFIGCAAAPAADPPPSLAGAAVVEFASVDAAARALGCAADYADWRRAASAEPGPAPTGLDPERARKRIAAALASERSGVWLGDAETADLLSSYGIPVCETARAEEPPQGGCLALAVGIVEQPPFGDLLYVGSDRTAVSGPDDRALHLLCLGPEDVDRLLRGLRVAPALFGQPAPGGLPPLPGDGSEREEKPLAIGALRDLLLRVARLAIDHPQVVALDLAVEVGHEGVRLGEARLRVAPRAAHPEFRVRRLDPAG